VTELLLKSLDITNFRSIRGSIHAPLDANVVLIHGENGAGKTSFLSAVELALTGSVNSLQRVDPAYEIQLMHRSAAQGSVILRAIADKSEKTFEAILSASGAVSITALDDILATFFKERAFLPQSHLGQLLQIYQDAGNDATSPLAQFVGNLLGLDRLDALEAGLKPLADIRSVRKTVDGWLAAENERSRLERAMFDQRKIVASLQEEVLNAINELVSLCITLQLSIEVREDTLHEVEAALSDPVDAEAFATLLDQQRKLESIRREIDAAQTATGSTPLPNIDEVSAAYALWEEQYGKTINILRDRIGEFLLNDSLPSDPGLLSDFALSRLRTEMKQIIDRVDQARSDIARYETGQQERDVALRQQEVIDAEVSRLSDTAGSLGSALAEMTSFILNEHCPICDRNFSEVSKTSLREHVHSKVRTLSASAERLLALGRTRGETQKSIERLDRELESISVRRLDEQTIANLDRRRSAIESVISQLVSINDALQDGARLRAFDVAARRAVSETQSRGITLAAARETLTEFALSVGVSPIKEDVSFDAATNGLSASFAAKARTLETRLAIRRRAGEQISIIRSIVNRRLEIDERLKADNKAWQRSDQILRHAQMLRNQGNTIRNAVDKIRSGIIRREFNDRLNRLWRDLFIRLAPGEPFVPAFRIPESATQRLQPKLITEHREGGDAGGTPGAMLSAGNLNTAALTLFIALHLSVPGALPWLILDDPVQSMDDVHIAHFAALIRTLSKEHGRQVMIAVHDRQLFEYLRLELSPAYEGDSLVTLELSRKPRRDSLCMSKRYSFKEETGLFTAA